MYQASFSKNRQYRGKSNKLLTNKQRQIIIGSILGDGCLEKRWANTRLRIYHSPKQKEYLMWKYANLCNLASSEPKNSFTALHKKTNKRYSTCYFSTLTLEELNYFHRLFYKNKRKIVPLCIKEIITPLAIAVWYMDDGYKRNDCSALRIGSDNYSLREQKILQDLLQDKFKIKSCIHRKAKYYNLYIPSSEAKKFCQTIFSYIVPSMRYKLVLTP